MSEESHREQPLLDARALAIGVLGIDDEQRLSEIGELGDLLDVIRSGIASLQATRPEEPPPTTMFIPNASSRNFWRGRPTVV